MSFLTGKRLNKDIDDIVALGDYDLLDGFVDDTDIDDSITKKLLNYQIVHVSKLLGCLKNNTTILDGSDTGTGKTYCAVALCKQMNMKPFIVCPKSVISTWLKVLKIFDCDFCAVVNYETLKTGKWYHKDSIADLKSTECPYVEVNEDSYRWNLPKNTIMIFDEAHRCKNFKSINGKMLLSTKNIKNTKKILLSATIADTIENFAIFGYLLDLYKDIKRSKAWIEDALRKSKSTGIKWIYKEIYPLKGSRMMIEEISNFPKSQIIAETFTSEDYHKLDRYAKLIKKYEKGGEERSLEKITYLLQKIEKIKIPILIDITKDLLRSGFHVVVFMNYLDNIHSFKEKMKQGEIMIGDTEPKLKDKIIKDFMNDKIDLVIVSKKMQEGLSFHDVRGRYPRATVISPSYSSQDLIQTLGRVKRAGCKTRSVQKIVFVANSFEESIADRLQKKIKFNENINDSDMKIKI